MCRAGGARQTAAVGERWIVHGPPALMYATDLAGSGPAGVARAKAAAIVATALGRACAERGPDRGEGARRHAEMGLLDAAHQQRRNLMLTQSITLGVRMSLATPLERKAYSESLGSALALGSSSAPAAALP